MGQNYNSWGGKNNSWGNRNKKGDSNKGGGSYKPTKVFNVIAGGFLVLCIVGGTINSIPSFIRYIGKNTGNEIEKPKVEFNQASKADNPATKKHIDNGLDIGQEVVENILEHMTDSTTGMVRDMVFIDISKVDTDEKYKSNVIDNLPNYKDTAMYVFVNQQLMEENIAEEMITGIKERIANNTDGLKDAGYNSTTTGAFRTNANESGDITFYVAVLFDKGY